METNGHCDHWGREVKHRWDSLDLRFPKSGLYATRPRNEQGMDRGIRSTQNEILLGIIAEAYSAIRAVIAD